MFKRLLFLMVMTSSVFMYGQHITFQKNVNSRASELIQYLNKGGDSLYLETKTAPIRQVDIFNENFIRSISVNNNTTKIDLKTLPIGNFVVQAVVDDKSIIMYLQKNADFKTASSHQNGATIYDNDLSSSNNSNLIKTREEHLYCWVVIESNSNFGSTRSMKLEYINDVDKLISKNKLELKSNVGKDNKLAIYIIYDKSKFMSMQLKNSNYYKTVEQSQYFNIEPLYVSETENDNKK